MSPAKVPDELVEKAARALRAEQCTGHDHGTDACPDRHCRDDRTLPFYRARVRPVLAAMLPEIQAQVLREAADEWQTGGWANVPRRADRVADRIGAAQYVCDWLRKRAARLTTTTERKS